MSPLNSELFAALEYEIQANTDELGSCSFWWRDDDLIAPTSQFTSLHQIALDLDIVPLVAIIPALSKPALAELIDRTPDVRFCQHGFAHRNHEPGNAKSEFGSARPLDALLEDVAAGQEKMRDLTGSKSLPIFVPPWNRASDELISQLAGLGFMGLSQHEGEPHPLFSAGLAISNTHIDVMSWGQKATVHPIEALVHRLTDQLRRRRFHVTSNSPIGLLTHHRVMSESDWGVVQQLFQSLKRAVPNAFETPDALFLLNRAP